MKIVGSFDAIPMINDQLMRDSLCERESSYCHYIEFSDGDASFSIKVEAMHLSKKETRIFLEGMKILVNELEKSLSKR